MNTLKFQALSLAILALFFFTTNARAALDFEDAAFPELVTSARALAMGNAYICKVDDSWSAFYNPAGLGTVRGVNFHLLNAHLEANNTMMNIVGNGPAYQIPKKYMDSFDSDNMRENLLKNKGDIAHSRFNIFPNFTVRGLTLGYMFSQRNRAVINDDAAEIYEIRERRDQGPVMALNASFFGGILKLGVSGVYLMRRELDKDIGPSDPATINDSDFKKGKSAQITLGSRLTLPWPMIPTFSAVVRNTSNKRFEGDDETGPDKMDRILPTTDLGFSITPQIGKRVRVHMEVNMRDIGNSYDTNAKRRLALGTELDFNRRLFLRAGYGDGWGSGGIGVRTNSFILDLTTYAVDRSLDGFRKEEDRRWVLSLSSGF